MLCPEVVNFEAPDSSFITTTSDFSEIQCLNKIDSLKYNHLVTVVLPNTLEIPEDLKNILITDCDYYKILNLNLSDLISEEFFNHFIRNGSLRVISINTRIDCDNCVSIIDKVIVLSLTSTTFYSSGLEGKLSHFSKKTKDRFKKPRLFIFMYMYRTMPHHCQVNSLKTLSLKSIGKLVVALSPHLLTILKQQNDPPKLIIILKKHLDFLNKWLVSYVPYYLYDIMAVEVLKSVKDLIEKTKRNYYPHTSMTAFLTEMNVVVSLTEVVLNKHLKQIDFSEWPKIMRYVLNKNLVVMTGLEVLNLGSCTGGWRTSEYDKYILNGISVMKNLKCLCLCFDCTDQIIQMIAENCIHIQNLDVTSSRSVTDRSIVSLLKCKKLRQLQLHRTSITVLGLGQLLIGLNKLEEIGRCDEFGNVIKCLNQNLNNCGPFALKRIQIRDLSTENLRLFVDMFPNIEYISLFHDHEQISDLTILTSLDNLKELKLLSCAFYGDYLKQLLEIKGYNIISLHLEHVEEIDLNALIDISQFCPKLKNLVLYNCDFLDGSSSLINLHQQNNHFKMKPFQHLERLFWMVDCAKNHLEFILLHSINIRNIHLGSSTGITHSSIVNILNVNPMKHLKELRILYSNDMNMRTVQLLLASCTNLMVLSELESWQGITNDELKQFKRYIESNNFDLDIRPTLSYY